MAGQLEAAALLALPGVEQLRRIGSSLRLTVTDVACTVPPLLALVAEMGLVAGRLATHHATLEDVFLAYAGHALEPEEES